MTTFLWVLTGGVGTIALIALTEMVLVWIFLPMAVTEGWHISKVVPKRWVRFCLRRRMDEIYLHARAAAKQRPHYAPLHVILFDDHIRRLRLHKGIPDEQLEDVVDQALRYCTIIVAIDLYARLRATERGNLWKAYHWKMLIDRHKSFLIRDRHLWDLLVPWLPCLRREYKEGWNLLADIARSNGRFFWLKDMYGHVDRIPRDDALSVADWFASKDVNTGDPLERLAALDATGQWSEIWRLAAVWQTPEMREKYLGVLHDHKVIVLASQVDQPVSS